ncbi:MAG: alpha amylase C-terminal domain-containing protein [Betaproteobacteria bacterium]|nr:alpha amylase C-terminal domain-containing protein [Betaproteobacteria bacterium]
MEYAAFFTRRIDLFTREVRRLRSEWGSLASYAGLYRELGMHKVEREGKLYWRFREWAQAANSLYLATDRINFERRYEYRFLRTDDPALWELFVPAEELPHGTYYELHVASSRTRKHVVRVPAFAVWVEQNHDNENQWCARVWDPHAAYVFKYPQPQRPIFPRIYEGHVGIAQSSLGKKTKQFGTYRYFAEKVLPRIKEGGYTTVQLMGIPEHPLYKSFGYQVSSYFAPSSRFGTPDDFRYLVDEAHRLGLGVILDITHSHACPNTEQGMARYDTSRYFFRRLKTQWETISFDYNQERVRRFLLSNCRYWLEEFKLDGFRFDAVGNMIYLDHGLDDDFSHVGRCFYDKNGKSRLDENGVLYLSLATTLVRELAPHAITIAEEFSGAPGMSCLPENAGLGFDYRFAMGLPDFWAKFIKEGQSMGLMWHELNNRRHYDKTISYTECHDQCINGDDAFIWRMIKEDMYEHMSVFSDSWKCSRGVALHKLMRFSTLAAAGQGWLNFMGNEFGHPEWIDAEGYAHRQWHLAETTHLKYSKLDAFDRGMLKLVREYPEEFRRGPRFRYIHEEDRILAFERGKLLFIFNFHELQTQNHLALMVTPGKYMEIFSSDEFAYAGHGNLSTRIPGEHFSDPASGIFEQRITLYMPPLTGLALARE